MQLFLNPFEGRRQKEMPIPLYSSLARSQLEHNPQVNSRICSAPFYPPSFPHKWIRNCFSPTFRSKCYKILAEAIAQKTAQTSRKTWRVVVLHYETWRTGTGKNHTEICAVPVFFLIKYWVTYVASIDPLWKSITQLALMRINILHWFVMQFPCLGKRGLMK